MAAPSDQRAESADSSPHQANATRNMAALQSSYAWTQDAFNLPAYSAEDDDEANWVYPPIQLATPTREAIDAELAAMSEESLDALCDELPSLGELDELYQSTMDSAGGYSAALLVDFADEVAAENLAENEGEGSDETPDTVPALAVDTGNDVDPAPQTHGDVVGDAGEAESDEEPWEDDDGKDGDYVHRHVSNLFANRTCLIPCRSYTKPVKRTGASLLKRALSSAELATEAKRLRTSREDAAQSEVEEDDATKVGQDSVRGSVEPGDVKKSTDALANVKKPVPTPDPIVWEFMYVCQYAKLSVVGHGDYITE